VDEVLSTLRGTAVVDVMLVALSTDVKRMAVEEKQCTTVETGMIIEKFILIIANLQNLAVAEPLQIIMQRM